MTKRKSSHSDLVPSITDETVKEYEEVSDSLAGLVQAHGLKTRDFVLLSFVCDQGSMEIDQVVDVLDLSRSSTLDCIDRLVKSDLVRQTAGSYNHDVILIIATEMGRKFVSKIDTATIDE